MASPDAAGEKLTELPFDEERQPVATAALARLGKTSRGARGPPGAERYVRAAGEHMLENYRPTDGNADGRVAVDELVRAVNAALFGYP